MTEASTDVAVRDERLPVLNPLTGEMVQASDTAAVALALDAIREKKRELDDWARLAVEYLAEASKREGTGTLRFGSVEVSVSRPDEIIVDFKTLRAALHAADCPDDRIDALTKPKTTYKMDWSVARQLSGANPTYKEIIERQTTRIPKAPTASVKR